jgi:hypothetical protein
VPSHEVLLNLHTKVISHKDVELEVRSDGSKLGTLLISKGNIEWLPANNSVNKYRMSWEAFSDVMIQCGRNVKF